MTGIVGLGVRSAARVLSGGSRLVVLHYHQVVARPDPLRPDVFTPVEFSRHMSVLAENFTVLPLAEAVDMLRVNKLPSRAVSVTFDDGYVDNYLVALPVLQHYRITATFFIAAGFLDGGCMFNDMVIEACRAAPVGNWSTAVPGMGELMIDSPQSRLLARDRLIAALKYIDPQDRDSLAVRLLESVGRTPPKSLMMTSEQVLALNRAGMDVGGHTLSHPILAKVDDRVAAAEIQGGRDALARITGRKPVLFAYPNGKPETDFLPRDAEIVRQSGFAAALTTQWGCAGMSSDQYQLPRIGSWDRTRMRFALRVLRTYLTPA